MARQEDQERRALILASLPRRIVAAGVLIRDPADRMLIVEPTYKPGWEIPGGVVESGETPRDAAARECEEELGRSVEVGKLLVLDHQVAPSDKGDAMMFVYDGGVVDSHTTFRLPADELRSWRFVHTGEGINVLGRALGARMVAAFGALRKGAPVELTDSKLG